PGSGTAATQKPDDPQDRAELLGRHQALAHSPQSAAQPLHPVPSLGARGPREPLANHVEAGEMTRSWTDFWDQQSDCKDDFWQDHIQRFVARSGPVLKYGAGDRVLDIGCGTGYLELALKDKVSEVWGVDTSQRFIDECLKRCEHVPNVHFAT